MELTANEIEMLVLKAARGGGVALGHSEDLSAAAAFLDMDALAVCPCSGVTPAAMAVPVALDLVAAGAGAQTVQAEPAVIAAYVACVQARSGRTLVWSSTPTGAVFERFKDRAPDVAMPFGRRTIPVTLVRHLTEMAAKLLVPETDASRKTGAGAGLNDND